MEEKTTLRRDLKVKPEHIGFWIKPPFTQTWHFLENTGIDSPTKRCMCGEYEDNPKMNLESAKQPDEPLNKKCQHRAERRAKQIEDELVEKTRAEIKALGREVMDITESAVHSAVVLCDPGILKKLLSVYKMATYANLVEEIKSLALDRFMELTILMKSGEPISKEDGEELLKLSRQLIDDSFKPPEDK